MLIGEELKKVLYKKRTKHFKNTVEVGGDHYAKHICDHCGHEMRFIKIDPTHKEVEEWLENTKCTICQKVLRTRNKNLIRYFRKANKKRK